MSCGYFPVVVKVGTIHKNIGMEQQCEVRTVGHLTVQSDRRYIKKIFKFSSFSPDISRLIRETRSVVRVGSTIIFIPVIGV